MKEIKRKIIAIIPARGGSKGLPGKNIRLLGGKPLIAHSIETAKKSSLVDRVIVTTDDAEIAEVAKRYGAEVPFLRPAELAEDDTPPDPVLKHTLEFLKEKENYKPDIIVWLEPPCPFRTPEEVDDAIRMLQEDPEADSLRAVCEPFQNPFKSWTLEGKYLNPLIEKKGKVFHTGPRQKTQKVYWQNGALFLLKYDTIMKKGNFFGDKILPYFMESDRFVDIDKKEDLELAEWYIEKFKIQNFKFKILNTLGKHFALEAKTILDSLGNVDYREITHEELLDVAGRYDVIVAGLYPMIDKAVIDKAKRLKCIALPANTLENIDTDYAKKKGIPVISLWGETKFLNTITGTAEMAAGLMIDLVRLTPWAFDSVKKYEWNREAFRGHNLYGQTLGIVGMGRLGTWMARYGKSFGMHVIFYSPYTKKSPVPGCANVSLDELLAKSDVISLHAHLNKETEKMFNENVFRKMKRSAYLINTARGKVVDEDALLNALEEKKIAGYAADVLADEFHFDDIGFVKHPLVEYARTHDNCIIVPHLGGMTHESRERTDLFTVQKLQKFLSTKK